MIFIPNVTPTEVLEIMDTDTTFNETTIVPFIRPANRIVIDRLTGAGLNADTLIEIERWLTAHCAVMSDRETQIESEGVSKAKTKYVGKTGMGFKATRYGQMALMLDTSGNLADMTTPAKRRASMFALDHINGGTT